MLLAHKKGQLQEGTAFDALWNLQTAVKVIDTLGDRKKKDMYGQEKNTQALTQIQEAEFCRHLIMASYNAACKAMIALCVDSRSFPNLTLQDTFQKSTNLKCAIGDSCWADGLLWMNTGVTAGILPF